VWGSFVVISNDDIKSFEEVSAPAFAALGVAITNLERMMKNDFGAVRLNLFSLMMVDPQVHFHVIPRFDKGVEYGGQTYVDEYYPGLAPLDGKCCVGSDGLEGLSEFFAPRLEKAWRN